MSTQSYEFKSEAQQLLDLMIHSLYSNKEIFLRELISNASDAVDKLRFEALKDTSLLAEGYEPSVRIHSDTSDGRRLIIEDNGIGMSRDEVIENLGTIAHSGTKAFAAKVKAAAGTAEDGATSEATESLIGQFGVGFYSAFMAAESVTVVTRRAGEETASRWHYAGGTGYTIDDTTREAPGTTIVLHLRDVDADNGLDDFTEEWVLRRIIKKYSDFVQYPVQLQITRTEQERDDEGKIVEGGEETTTTTWETVNSMKAIWRRNPDEVTEEEYAEFYKHITHDWNAPFERISFKAEGMFEYRALLFVPESSPHDLFYRDAKWGLQLFVKNVQIMDKCSDLLPDWLRFVKGVVDSPDLSLNVSREILQNDRRVRSIRKRVTKKVTEALKKIQTDDAERYQTFWKAFGTLIKEGVTDRELGGSKVHDLLLFASTNEGTELVSLADYVSRMKEEQEAIYFITGESIDAVKNSPHLEVFADKGYEVLFLTDAIDEIMVGHLSEYDGKALKSVGKGEVELGTEEEKEAAEKDRKEKEETFGDLLGTIKGHLDEHIKAVRLSTRLKTSAVCLVSDEDDLSPGMERILAMNNQSMAKTKRILELNPEHPVLATLKTFFEADAEDSRIAEYSRLLHGQALIAEGAQPADPVQFAQLVADLMVRS